MVKVADRKGGCSRTFFMTSNEVTSQYIPCFQDIRVNSRILKKPLHVLPTCFNFSLGFRSIGVGRDSFEPDRKSFRENERILAVERSIVIQIKVEVFCFSNSHTIC